SRGRSVECVGRFDTGLLSSAELHRHPDREHHVHRPDELDGLRFHDRNRNRVQAKRHRRLHGGAAGELQGSRQQRYRRSVCRQRCNGIDRQDLRQRRHLALRDAGERVMLRRMMMAGGNGGGGGDPNWSSRVALLHFDGSNGSTTFYDEKLGGNWTGSGNAQISTAQSRDGGASLLLDGTGDWIDTPDTAAWAFGGGDFFIEASIYIPDTTGVKTIISQWGTDPSDRAWTFYVNGSTLTLAGSPGPVFASANGVTANAWHDVAAGRIGNTIYVWLNGSR